MFRNILSTLLFCTFLGASGNAVPFKISFIADMTGSSAGEGAQFQEGFYFALDKLNSTKYHVTNKATQKVFDVTVEVCDTATDNEQAAECVATAEAHGADVIVAGTSKTNSAIISAAQSAGIPNIHLSGGNPAMWKVENTFAVGMHVPFIDYTKPIIESAKNRGLKHIAILRTKAHGFSSKSCIAALKWATDAGLTVVGPSATWCEKWGSKTNTCRMVGAHCRCGTQSEVEELAPYLGANGNYSIAAAPTFYEINEGKLDGGFAVGDKVESDTAAFAMGIVEDLVMQGADPVDVFLNFAGEWHSVLYGLWMKNYAPQLMMGWQGGTGPTWAEQTMASGEAALTAAHGYWAVGFGQWHKALVNSDPVFGSSTEAVKAWAQKYPEKPDMPYNSAGGAVAAVVLHEVLSNADASYVSGKSHTELSEAIRKLDFTTLWGPVSFNSAGQSTGRDPAAWQVIPDSEGLPEQLAVLPTAAREVEMVIPFPKWCSAERGLCPPGVKAKCVDVKEAYRMQACCGMPSKPFHKTMVSGASTCGDVQKAWRAECCGKSVGKSFSKPAVEI